MQALQQLAFRNAVDRDYDNAMERLLELMKKDRSFGDEAGRRMLSGNDGDGRNLWAIEIDAVEAEETARYFLEKVRISEQALKYPGQLSGGQQQRVAIARAVVSNPRLILADEPTGNLDSINGEEIMSLLTQLNTGGTTIIMVTHSPSDADKAHRIIQLFDGHIVTENIRKAMKTG